MDVNGLYKKEGKKNRMRESVKRQYYFATWLRVAGVFLILMCHFVQQSSNVLLVASGQLFNIGVQIFIILSGFLFGVGGGR